MIKTGKVIRVSSIVAALLACCLALLFLLAPLLINTETVRTKVSAWITEKTGGMVTFQRVDVSFFPRPKVEVSEVSAAITDKGTVTAGSVTVYLSLLPLVSGKVDVSRVLIVEPKISLDVTPREPSPEEKGEKKTVDEVLADLASRFHGLTISVDSGTISISKANQTLLALSDVYVRFSTSSGNINADLGVSAGSAKRVKVAMRFDRMDSPEKISLEVQGSEVDIPSLRENAFSLAGDNRTVKSVFSYLRGGKVPEISVRMTGGTFAELGGSDDLIIRGHLQDGQVFIPGPELVFQNVNGSCSISGGILRGEGLHAGMDKVRIEKGLLAVGLKGQDAPFHFEAETRMNFSDIPPLLDRFLEKRPFPFDRLRDVRGPVTGRLVLGESVAMFRQWKGNGHLGFDGRISADSGPVVDLALAIRPKAMEITKLNIRDGASSAALAIVPGEKSDRVSFKGRLERKTIDKLIDLPNLPEGFMEGEIEASINRRDLLLSTAHGRLSVQKMPLRLNGRPPVELDSVRLKTEGNRLTVESLEGKIAGNAISVKGSAGFSSREIAVDLDVSAERLRWEDVSALFEGGEKKRESTTAVTGTVRLKAGTFLYGGITVSPAKAGITMSRDVKKIAIDTATLRVGDDPAAVAGWINVSPKAIAVDLDVTAKTLKWEALKSLFRKDRVQPAGGSKVAARKTPMSGSVRFASDAVFMGTKKISPARAVLSLEPEHIRVSLPDVMYCGIRAPGKVSFSGDILTVDFSLSADGQDLNATLDCLSGDKSDISGKFVLKGALNGEGNADQIMRTLRGDLEFRADGGRINKSIIFLNLYSLLNVSGYFSGNITDLFRKGISYRFITVKADFRDGKMIIREADLDAPSIEVVAMGEIDLVTGKVDLQMLATPMTTVDVVLGNVPFIGKAARGSIVSLPVSVTGDLDKPVVRFSSASGAGSGLVNLMKKAVGVPVTIVQPGASDKEKTPSPRNNDSGQQ